MNASPAIDELYHHDAWRSCPHDPVPKHVDFVAQRALEATDSDVVARAVRSVEITSYAHWM